jgi:hypothetical protein
MPMWQCLGRVGNMQPKIWPEEGIFSRADEIEILCFGFEQRWFDNLFFVILSRQGRSVRSDCERSQLEDSGCGSCFER